MPQGLKPIIFFGQDETAFNLFIFNGSMCICPDGEQSIIPKINGLGVMVLAFQSRETEFGLKISNALIKLINERFTGKHYFEKLAA